MKIPWANDIWASRSSAAMPILPDPSVRVKARRPFTPVYARTSGEPGALDGLSDVLRADLLTLTSSGSVRWSIGGPAPRCARRAVCVVEP